MPWLYLHFAKLRWKVQIHLILLWVTCMNDTEYGPNRVKRAGKRESKRWMGGAVCVELRAGSRTGILGNSCFSLHPPLHCSPTALGLQACLPAYAGQWV